MSEYPEHILNVHRGGREVRNVIDHYAYWNEDAIKADLEPKRHPFAFCCENFAYDMNIATIVRTSNAFLAQEVFFVGRRSWDKRGAIGAHHYEKIRKYPDWQQLEPVILQEGYTPVAIDNVDQAENIFTFQWPEKPLLILGQEQIGVSPPALQLAEHTVYIPQFGSIRSLNVGVAGSLAAYDFLSKTVAHLP